METDVMETDRDKKREEYRAESRRDRNRRGER